MDQQAKDYVVTLTTDDLEETACVVSLTELQKRSLESYLGGRFEAGDLHRWKVEEPEELKREESWEALQRWVVSYTQPDCVLCNPDQPDGQREAVTFVELTPAELSLVFGDEVVYDDQPVCAECAAAREQVAR